MADTIIDEIKAAQAAPADDYMVWANIGSDDDAHQVVLHTVRLPQSIGTDRVLERIRAQAEKTLADCGYPADKVTGAALHISALPSVEETEAELEANRGPDTELALVDLVMWEACRHRLHLTPYAVENGDIEMEFQGLKIRRGAAL